MPFVMTPDEMFADVDKVDVNNYEDMAERIQKYSQLMRFRPGAFKADEFSEGRLLMGLKEASGKPARVLARCSVLGNRHGDWDEFRLLSVPGLWDPYLFPRLKYLLHNVEAEGDLMGNPQYGCEQLYVVPEAVGDHLDRMEPAPEARMEVMPEQCGQTARDIALEILCAHAWFPFKPGLREVASLKALCDEVEASRATWERGQLLREGRRDAR